MAKSDEGQRSKVVRGLETGAVPVGAVVGMGVASKKLQPKIVERITRPLTAEPLVDANSIIADIFPHSGIKRDIKVTLVPSSVSSGRDVGMYVSEDVAKYRKWGDKEFIALGEKTSPFTAAHEFGHAKRAKPFGHLLQRITRPAAALGILGGMGLLGHGAYNIGKDEDLPASVYAAPAAAALGFVPEVAEEARATFNARKMLRKAKVNIPNLGKLMRSQIAGYAVPRSVLTLPFALGAGYLGYRHKKLRDAFQEKQGSAMDTPLEILARFRKNAEGATTSTSSSSGMSVEGPKMSTSFNTPSTGHMGVFKGTGMANTSRIKVSEFFRQGYLGVLGKFAAKKPEYKLPVGIGTGLGALGGAAIPILGASILAYPFSRGNYPTVIKEVVKEFLEKPEGRRALAAGIGLGGLVGGTAGATYAKAKAKFQEKQSVLTKHALGIQQPNMVTKSLRSAAGREGGYTAGNLAKGSGAFKPTRATATFSEGKSSAMDKM